MGCWALWRPEFRHFAGIPLPIRWISRTVGLLQQAPNGGAGCRLPVELDELGNVRSVFVLHVWRGQLVACNGDISEHHRLLSACSTESASCRGGGAHVPRRGQCLLPAAGAAQVLDGSDLAGARAESAAAADAPAGAPRVAALTHLMFSLESLRTLYSPQPMRSDGLERNQAAATRIKGNRVVVDCKSLDSLNFLRESSRLAISS